MTEYCIGMAVSIIAMDLSLLSLHLSCKATHQRFSGVLTKQKTRTNISRSNALVNTHYNTSIYISSSSLHNHYFTLLVNNPLWLAWINFDLNLIRWRWLQYILAATIMLLSGMSCWGWSNSINCPLIDHKTAPLLVPSVCSYNQQDLLLSEV